MKTFTLSHDEDNPSYTLLEGHHDAQTFSKAMRAEGWDMDDIHEDDISHEYWVQEEARWCPSNKEDPKAIPVTVSEW